MIRHWIRRSLALSLLVLAIEPALAAPPSDAEQMQQVVDSLQARVARLEEVLTAFDSRPPPEIVFGTDSVEYLAGRAGGIYLPRRALSEPLQIPTPAVDVPPATPALEVYGMLEGLGNVQPRDGRSNTAQINQAEIDFGRELSPRARMDVCLYYGGDFIIGAATASYALRAGGEDAPRRWLHNATVVAGKFDIPFGLDYEVYGPLARKAVTMPLSVESTYGWWNDVGLQTTLSGALGSVDLYAVKGMETTIWNSDEALPEAPAEDDEHWATVQPSISSGLRLNFVPWESLQCGLSLARGWARSGTPSLSLAGLHLQHTRDWFTVKAEGIMAAKAEDVRPHRTRGAYLETGQRLGKPFLFQRFDYCHHQQRSHEQAFSLGAGLEITPGLECRTEFRRELLSSSSDLFLQVVAGF